MQSGSVFIIRQWRDKEVIHQPKGTTLWFRWKFTSTSRSVFSNRRKVYYELIRSRALLKTMLSDREYAWGLDVSLAGTGLCIMNLKTGYVMLDRFTTHKMASLVDRSCSLIDWLGSKYELYKPAIILMESTFYSQGMAESIILTKLNHAVEVGLYSMGGALYKAVAPQSLKKYIAGTGPARKAAIQTVLEELTGIPIHSNDLADAFGLGIIARDLYRIMTEFPLDKYDINDKNSLRHMLDEIGDCLKNGKRSDVIFSILSGNTNNMFSIAALLPEIKRASIDREFPIFVRYNPSEKKKLIAKKK